MDNGNNDKMNTKDRKKSIKKVCWDEEKLAEQMEERIKNPKMKITEPKTPFNEIDDNETDEYLLKLKEVNQIVPDKESLEKALEALSKKNNDDNDDQDDDKKRERNKQMQKKAYANEFLLTKKLTKELENEDDDIVKETLENTVYNKYIGKLTKDSNNE